MLPLLQNLMTALLTYSLYQSKGGFLLPDNFYVHKSNRGDVWKALCKQKVEWGSTFTFMHDLPYIASILFTYVKFMLKIVGQWKYTLKPSHWHHHLWQVGSFFAHRYPKLVGLFHLNVMTNHLHLLFLRRSTYNHLSSWLTDARNLTNPNTVMSSKCHTSCFFQ